MQRPITLVSARSFFILTFVLSWLVWIPLLLAHFGIGPFHIPEETITLVRLLGVLMPALSALILSALAGGWREVVKLLGRLAIWRVGLSWWAAAVIVPPVMLVGTAAVFNLLGGNPPITVASLGSLDAFIVYVVFLALATLGEEIGWRGVALPALQSNHSALQASAILGILWAAWHIPFWLLLESFTQYGIGYLVLNVLFVVTGTFYITWFFNHTRSSLLLPVGFHLSFNLVNVGWLPVTLSVGAFGLLIVFQGLISALTLPWLERGKSDQPGTVAGSNA